MVVMVKIRVSFVCEAEHSTFFLCGVSFVSYPFALGLASLTKYNVFVLINAFLSPIY